MAKTSVRRGRALAMKQLPILGLDVGGTKVAAALVSHRGQVRARARRLVDQSLGPSGFAAQIIEVCDELLGSSSMAAQVGMACAGPLDSRRGELLDPTNFFTDGKSWGRVPLLKMLKKSRPKLKFALENDAAAAVLAEFRWGAGRGKKNVLAMTLGTGVGIGAIVGGELALARAGLHPEASHIPLNAWDQTTPCGCGQYGCIEAYLSGKNFAARLAKLWSEPRLTGEEILARAQAGDGKTLAALRDYAEHLAQALAALAVLYAPEVVALSGGFSGVWQHVREPTQVRLAQLLARRREGFDLLPRIVLSELGEDLGVLAGAGIVTEAGVADGRDR